MIIGRLGLYVKFLPDLAHPNHLPSPDGDRGQFVVVEHPVHSSKTHAKQLCCLLGTNEYFFHYLSSL